MKWLAMVVALGLVTACSGGSSGTSSPTAPTAAAPTTANVAGSYDLTITASSTCSANLPQETRVLKYVANVTQTGGAVQVQLLAHVIWNTVGVSGTVSGQTVSFTAFSFSEITTAGGVALHSTGVATVASDGSMSGTLTGAYQTAGGATCNASNHQIQLTKRVVQD